MVMCATVLHTRKLEHWPYICSNYTSEEMEENSSQALIPCSPNYGSDRIKTVTMNVMVKAEICLRKLCKLLLWLRSVISIAAHCPQESSRDSAYDGGVSSGTGSREPTPVAVCPVVLTRRLTAQKVKK